MIRENQWSVKTLDVSDLPETTFDYRAPIWWGNTLGLVIETVAFACLIAVYTTVWMNMSPFPPPLANRLPFTNDPLPDLTLPTINLLILLLSLIPGIWLDLSARKKNEKAIKILLLVTLSLNLAAMIIRFYEYDSLYFKWDDNAYGSITWTILGMHHLHLFILFCEDLFLMIWTYLKGIDDKHALDLTVMAVYWYWVVGIWVLFYALVYLAPRFL
jgi:heme/copper-type cytochrome/quinol oxidase subunit 3